MVDLERIAQRIPKVWEVYTNPYLQEQIGALSASEKAEVDGLVMALIQDAPLFHVLHTKPHASREERGIDHVSYGVWNHIQLPQGQSVDLYLESLGKNLGSILPEDLRQVLERPTFSDLSTIAILPFPENARDISSKYVVVKCDFNTTGTAVYDKRTVHNGYVLVIKANSQVINFLRNKRNARLFSYAMRNAAVATDTHSAVYFDATLEDDRNRQKLAVLDLHLSPRKIMLWWDKPGGTAQFYQEFTNDREFREYAEVYEISRKDPRSPGDPRGNSVEIYPMWAQSPNPQNRVYDFARVDRILSQK